MEMMTRSGNPALKENVFKRVEQAPVAQEGVMTIQGTVGKVALLLLTVVASGALVWFRSMSEGFAGIATMFYGGAIGGFIVSLIIIFNQRLAPVLALPYAVLEGLVLGGISAFMEQIYPGIVSTATVLTFGTFAALLATYQSGLIRATGSFRRMVVSATGAIAIYYLLSFVLSFFGMNLPLIHDSGMAGIIFSLIVVGVAAMNLVLDFDFIEQGARQGAPKYMEWYGAFGLMVTLVWLYIELLRLLAKTRRR